MYIILNGNEGGFPLYRPPPSPPPTRRPTDPSPNCSFDRIVTNGPQGRTINPFLFLLILEILKGAVEVGVKGDIAGRNCLL